MELSEVTKKYWQQEDWEALEKAEQITELFVVAKRVIDRMPKTLVQVCGPISTGGLGSIEANLENFNNTIIRLQEEGLYVFDQMPFEGAIKRIRENKSSGGYYECILNDFYLPIFESGSITKFYFISDWETSHGAQWEHKQAKNLEIEIIYLK